MSDLTLPQVIDSDDPEDVDRFVAQEVAKHDYETKKIQLKTLFVWGSVACVAFVGLSAATYHWLAVLDWFATDIPHPTKTAGEIGDMFGIVNAAFSGLAAVLFYIALRLQREDLKFQSQEMVRTRIELISSKRAQQDMAHAQRESAEQLSLAAYISALSAAANIHDGEVAATSRDALMGAIRVLEKKHRAVNEASSVFRSYRIDRIRNDLNKIALTIESTCESVRGGQPQFAYQRYRLMVAQMSDAKEEVAKIDFSGTGHDPTEALSELEDMIEEGHREDARLFQKAATQKGNSQDHSRFVGRLAAMADRIRRIA